MKVLHTTLAAAVAAGALLAAPVHADEALAKKHNCLACHTIDKKSWARPTRRLPRSTRGRTWPRSSRRKVKKGGQGVWGQMPMAPNATVPDADIKKLVAWILAM
jgi:cytochrome c